MSDIEEVKANGEETPEEKANKETKKYIAVLGIVKNIVGGEENLRPRRKVRGDEAAVLVAELFKEEEVALREKVKAGLKTLLKQHVELEAEVNRKKKELETTQLEKRKEFTKAAHAWLNQVTIQETQTQAYSDALKTAFSDQKEK